MPTDAHATTARDGAATGDDEQRLLAIVSGLVRESSARTGVAETVGLDARLDRDLGLDSLGRTELLLRLETEFGVGLPERTLLAETPRDLLRAVRGASGAVPGPGTPPAPEEVAVASGRVIEPVDAATLIEVLDRHAATHPDRVHLYLYTEADQPRGLTYAELRDGAARVAAGLRRRGLQPGRTVAIMLPTGLDYFHSFLGILLAGGIPVPIYPPARPSGIEEHLRRHARILDNAGAALLIAFAEVKAVARLLQAQLTGLETVLEVDELTALVAGDQAPEPLPPRAGTDIAMLQYTSGSTGDPKGVILTHADLLANIRAMGRAVEVNSDDVFVSWLPLYHDMGLIGAWLGSLYFAFPLVVMSPLRFLARPSRWLWAIHHHRGTLSAAPNFGYELCLSKVPDQEIQGLNLSSWRRAFNGAEPVSPDTLERFARRFAPFGLHATTPAPVYGLAEAAVGLAFPPSGRGPLIDWIDRDRFTHSGRAEPLAEGDPRGMRVPACGQPLPGYEIRIVDALGAELPERREGRIEFTGPSATSGYYRNPEATARLYRGDWLDTGDRGYIAEGDLFLTGRDKDLIIRGGRNLYPYELEQAIGNLEGIRKGCVAVFADADRAAGSERLVVVAETRARDERALDRLRRAVRETTTELLSLPPDEVVLVPPHSVLKTSSGKIRRTGTRELYRRGTLGRTGAAPWRQLLRLAAGGALPQLRRGLRTLGELTYAVYAWALFGLLTPLVWIAVVASPVASWRWAVVRGAIGLLRRAVGVSLTVHGREHLPAAGTPYLVVINHGSYLDALFLIEALGTGLRFVAKAELRDNPWSRWFLTRLGTVFVERFDVRRGAEEAQRAVRAVREGGTLVFFPEGTFRRMPGLLPFRMGAFAVAAEAAVPVTPVTLRGPRSLLRAGSRIPRRAIIDVRIDAPLAPTGSDWQAATDLRRRAREVILRNCGEPDLGA